MNKSAKKIERQEPASEGFLRWVGMFAGIVMILAYIEKIWPQSYIGHLVRAIWP